MRACVQRLKPGKETKRGLKTGDEERQGAGQRAHGA